MAYLPHWQSLHWQHLHSVQLQLAHLQQLQGFLPADDMLAESVVLALVFVFILKCPGKSGQLPQDTRSGFTLWEGQQGNQFAGKAASMMHMAFMRMLRFVSDITGLAAASRRFHLQGQVMDIETFLELVGNCLSQCL